MPHALPSGSPSVYVVARRDGGINDNPFAATTAVTLAAAAGLPANIEVFAATAERVPCHYDPASGRAIYMVGRAIHPSIDDTADLLMWCADHAVTRPDALRDLLGAFVIVIDDRRQKRVSFISDVLGLRPWFVGQSGGRLVAGTDVLGICDAGLSTGEADYDCLSSFLCYNFDCTFGSVVKDYRRIAGGAVSTFSVDGAAVGESAYATLVHRRQFLKPDDLVEQLHGRVKRTVDRLLQGHDQINLPLSGGFDSRLLCALASADRSRQLHVPTFQTRPQESQIAKRVAETLGVPHRVIPVERSLMDLHDDPLFFRPEGFPVPRNLTHAAARLHPGMPLLSGFLGGVLMRGLNGAIQSLLDLDEQHAGDQELVAAAHDYFLARTNRTHLLRAGMAGRIEVRALAAMAGLVTRYRATGRPMANVYLQLRQRQYISGIVMGHLDVAEPLMPFYSWDLLQFNASHVGSFTADTYSHLYRRFFPAMAEIPHESKLAKPSGVTHLPDRPSRHVGKWSAKLLRSLPGGWARSAIAPAKLLKYVATNTAFGQRHHHEIGFMHRVSAMEQRLRQAGVRLDWSQV